jgi:hypothetical protein
VRRVVSSHRDRWARAIVVATLALIVLCFPRVAQAFPWMIRHEYVGCTTCHHDPSGAGILTAYGRAQSEVLVRTPYGKPSEDDEDPSKLGKFALGVVPLPAVVDVQADGRLAWLRVAPPSPAPATSRFVLMQSDLAGAIKLDHLRAAASVGYVHEGALGASVTHGAEDRVVSRYHWAGASFDDDKLLVRAGRMPIPFGLRMMEHTMWVRSATRTDINASQSHGLAMSLSTGSVRGELMAVAGNLQLAPPSLRERGYAGFLEYTPGPSFAAGASSAILHAELTVEEKKPAFRQAHGLFARWTPARPLVVLAETDLLLRSVRGSKPFAGNASMLQLDVEPIQGVHAIATGELLCEKPSREGCSVGGWGSAAWFFLPHVDVRADVIVRNVDAGGDRASVVTVLAQLHAFL